MTNWRAALMGLALGVAVLAGVVTSTGCAAPTLPIPPPTALSSTPDATGMVTVTGTADPTAFVFVLNNMTDTGVIAHANPDRTFSIRVTAASMDHLSVWQEISGRGSEPNMITVP